MELFNAKKKIYPNGKTLIYYCNQSIFHKPNIDEETKIDESDTGEVLEDVLNDLEQCDDVKSALNVERAVSRAKRRIFDIAYCNDWRYFITLTIDDNIVNGYDVKSVSRKLDNFLHNCSKRYGLSYIIIPEYHKSGRVHMHGLINDALKVVDSGTRIVTGYSKPISVDVVKSKHLEKYVRSIVYNLPQWTCGFSTAVPTYGDGGALATYCTKYMTKATTKIFGNYYWSSRDLVREPEIEYFNAPDYVDIDTDEYSVPNTSIKLKYVSEYVFTKD